MPISPHCLLRHARSVGLLIFLHCLAIVLPAAEPFSIIAPEANWKYNDQSVDLGDGWIAPSYDDGTWSNSLAAIGFRALNNGNYQLPPPNLLRSVYYVTNFSYSTNFILTNQITVTNITTTTNIATNSFIRKNTPTNAVQNIMTFYFRKNFTFTNQVGGLVLTASNLIDDGAVFYLNGRELTRVAMPGGDIFWSSAATRTDPIGTSRVPTITTHGYDVFNLPVDALVQGENVMAVEVHQGSSGSSFMAFQMELWGLYPNPTPLILTNQPVDLKLEEGNTVQLRAGVFGDGGHYQWYRQGVGPVSGAVSDTLYIANAQVADSGGYYLVVTNIINAITTRVAQVSIVVDTTPPFMVDASGTATTTNIFVAFSEALSPITATNLLNYKVTNTLGGTLTVTRAVLTNATNVWLTTSTGRLPNNNYILIASGIRDLSARSNVITANSMIPISNLGTVVGMNTTVWKFYDPYVPFDNPDLGTAWRQSNYPLEANWSEGEGVFFDGANPAGVPGEITTSLSQTDGLITYFRYTVNDLQLSPGNQRLLLTHILDDGAILYLNGTEIFRTNMPTGPVNYQTPASATVNSPSRIGPITVNGNFVQGTNVLALELHQNRVRDTDKVFGLKVDAYARSVVVGPAIITGGPFDVTVQEGQPATFEVVQVGGSSFQWQMNSNALAGSDNYFFTTNGVPLSLDGAKFRVTVNGGGNVVTSSNATLHVVADTNAPSLISGYATNDAILLTFSENLSAATATTLGNYLVTNGLGQVFAAGSAQLISSREVNLTFASLPPDVYYVVVNNVRDASLAGNTIPPSSTVKVGYVAEVLPIAAVWRYQQNTNDLRAQGWTARTYNDSAWPSGAALLDAKAGGRNPATLPTPIGTVLLAPTNGPGGAYMNTAYFRTHFSSYGAGTATLTFRTVLDDAAVIYLNGVEIYRLRMAAGTVTYATQGTGASVGDATFEGPFNILVTNLLAGDNAIAVEVHQIGNPSPDITWGGDFSVAVPSTLVADVPVVPPPSCTFTPYTSPTLRFQRANGTNLVISWTNPVTNSCGSNALFTLQQAFTLTNPISSTVWSNVTTVSPYTASRTNNSRFFRLKL